MTSPWLSSIQQLLASAGAAVLRVAMLVLGLLLGLAAVVLGLLLTLGLVIWALLRGRKPVIQAQHFRWSSRSARTPGGDRAEVVDVEAREVDETRRKAPSPLLERDR
jgi:hypothetical protein